MLALGCIALVVVVGPHGRPLAQDLLIVALVATIESTFLVRTGSTPGMRVVDIRVVSLDGSTRLDWLTAWRRAVPVALCYPILLPGLLSVMVMPFALLLSIALSPLRRGFHDRLSGTVVVQENAPASIAEADLATWWHPDHAVVMSPWGRVPGLFDRRRARAHRIDGAWWLAGLLLLATIASAGIRDIPMLWVWMTLLWMIVVGVDEAWWLANRGATPGHEHFGFRVVDLATGQAPTRGRAALRALVLVPLIVIPPLPLLLALWVHASSLHRGPHDLIAKTIVVEPGFIPPEFLAPQPIPSAPGYVHGHPYPDQPRPWTVYRPPPPVSGPGQWMPHRPPPPSSGPF